MSRRMLRARLLAAMILSFVASAGVARADGWTAPSVDFTTAAQSMVTSVGTMISTVLPIGVTLLGITVGVAYFLKFIRRTAR